MSTNTEYALERTNVISVKANVTSLLAVEEKSNLLAQSVNELVSHLSSVYLLPG